MVDMIIVQSSSGLGTLKKSRAVRHCFLLYPFEGKNKST
jgi:hypothetical protein